MATDPAVLKAAHTPPLSLPEAQARLLALAPLVPTEQRPVDDCRGYYLCHDLTALRTQPAAPLSAMDGFALRSGDLPGPWCIVGESAAGRPFDRSLGTGEAVRISTGAVVPPDADMVLIKEDATVEGVRVHLTGMAPDPTERHIRPRGMDFAQDKLLLSAGTRLGPAQIALAIAAGHETLTVRRALDLVVIDSGDELAVPGTSLLPHQIPASNGPMLAAMAASQPVRIRRIGPVPDRLDALADAFAQAAGADLIVTSGGASVGDHDLLRPALEAAGATIDFWRVGIKPGKPLMVARRGAQLILGLPGNPAASFVTGFLFMLPLMRASLGAAEPLPRTTAALLAEPMTAGGSRQEFLRAHWDGRLVTLDSLQDSGALGPLARANALVVRDARSPAVPAGGEVPVYLLDFG
ncbi:molybdopterin molybdotransferase MoeA [Novosphingobium sp.]|uniref:molybdopterin molybdotransferase MoeA n=1 Tax=Novosphingobium sp. TaxID=1874826 RepID=UPI0038B91A16